MLKAICTICGGLVAPEDEAAHCASHYPRAQSSAVDPVRHMVNRFLGWRLPTPWSPDNGISYTRPNYAHFDAGYDWPTGTNLFDARQAEAMVRYMMEGMPAQSTTAQPQPRAESQPVMDAGEWVLIPREPTAAMIQAAIDTFGMQPSFAAMRKALRAALASPQAPVSPDEGEGR